jgi:Tol biopolymer transport system component
MGKGSIAALAAATALLAAASPASATYMRLVSTPSGVPGPGPTSEPEKPDSTYPAISADGRYIAFPSERSDLVPGDTNGRTDIFVRDLQTDTTERVSLTSAGAQATSPTGRDDEMFFSPPAISADGRYVAFDSLATDLVPGDTNGAADIFVRDRLMGTTERASVAGAEIQADGHSFPGVSISADGRYVTFQTGATNLDDYGPPGSSSYNVVVRDRLAMKTRAVGGGYGSSAPTLSSNGGLVSFFSYTPLQPGDTPFSPDVFVRNLGSSVVQRASQSSAGEVGNGPSYDSRLSGDGSVVAFDSEASNLVPGDTNGVRDMFVHTLATAQTERVSVASDGTEGNGPSPDNFDRAPTLSADGRYVAFLSQATNFDDGAANDPHHVGLYIRDRSAGTTVLASVRGNRAAASSGFGIALSADGRYLAFSTFENFLPSDSGNSESDVYVADLTQRPSGASVATLCPPGTSDNVFCGIVLSPRAARASAAGRLTELVGDFTKDRAVGTNGRDRIRGADGDDHLDGRAGADTIFGGQGDDFLIGSAGKDTFNGGAGRDRINAAGQAGERISCGPGRDRVTGAKGDRVSKSCERVSR